MEREILAYFNRRGIRSCQCNERVNPLGSDTRKISADLNHLKAILLISILRIPGSNNQDDQYKIWRQEEDKSVISKIWEYGIKLKNPEQRCSE